MSQIPELLERYLRGTDVVAAAVAGAIENELDFSPAPGKWTVRQIVAHLADVEVITVVRFRHMIAEDNPTFFVWDQDLWASRTDYQHRDVDRCLQTMRSLREDNYQLLRSIPEESFERTGTHFRHGKMTVLQLLELFTKHAEKHAEQIRNARAAQGAQTAVTN